MIKISALILPDTFAASLAPLLDAFAISRERSQRTVGTDTGNTPDLRLRLLSIDGRDVSLAGYGTLRIDGAICSDERPDLLWIPAFRAYGRAELADRLAVSAVAVSWLRQVAAQGTTIGASGAAVVLPMAAELTQDLAVPVATPLVPMIRELFPRFRHAPDLTMADRREILLSRGISHDVHAITVLFGRLLSPEAARWLRAVFGGEAEPDDPLAQGDGRDPLVDKARVLLEQRFATPVSISALAAELNVSHAVLIRHVRRELGMTPARYVQQLRMHAAQRMLLHSNRTIDGIAGAVGYGDARMFREMFRKSTGLSASAWRRSQRIGRSAAAPAS